FDACEIPLRSSGVNFEAPGISLSITYMFCFDVLASARMLSAELLSVLLHPVVISATVKINTEMIKLCPGRLFLDFKFFFIIEVFKISPLLYRLFGKRHVLIY